MNVRNCRKCGRIFNYVAGPLTCQPCREQMEAKFQEVKEYIRQNPGVTIPEVSAACEVEAQQVQQWLRDERLELTEDSPIRMICEGCGAQIRSGKYCDKCKYNMSMGFQSILDEKKPKVAEPEVKRTTKEKEKMRFL